MNMFLTRSRRVWLRTLLTRDTKLKLTWSLFILISLVVFIDSFGFVKIYFEKDFETEFSYPLDVDDFPGLVNRFRKGEHTDYLPTNTNYSAGIKFNNLANEDCGGPLGLLILVKSAPSYFEKRAAIRATWGNAQYLLNISKSISPSSSLISCFQNQLDKSLLNLSHWNLKNQGHGSSSSSPFPIKLVFLLGLMENDSYSGSTVTKAAPVVTATNLERDTLTRTPHNSKSKQSDSSNSLNSFNNVNQISNKDYKNGQTTTRPERPTSRSSSRLRRRGRRRGGSVEDIEESLKEEILKYNDIVRGDFIDSYENNTFKAMMGLRWASEICSDFQYAFLVDDDMYISVNNLIRFIENPLSYPAEESDPRVVDDLYAGKVIVTRPVRVKLGSKWYLSLDEYPYNHFPPYMPAAAILMSKSVVQDFYYASYFTQHFRFDDIFLAIMAHKMKINPLSSNYFHVCHTLDGKCPDNSDINKEISTGTDPMENVIARHGLTGPKELIQLWNEQKLAGKLI